MLPRELSPRIWGNQPIFLAPFKAFALYQAIKNPATTSGVFLCQKSWLLFGVFTCLSFNNNLFGNILRTGQVMGEFH